MARPCLSQSPDQVRGINHASDALGGGERLQVLEEIDVQVRIELRALLVRGGSLWHPPILATAPTAGKRSPAR